MKLKFGHQHAQKNDGSTEASWIRYTCGHCGTKVSGAVLATTPDSAGAVGKWIQCSECHEGCYLNRNGRFYPGSRYGPEIAGLPTDVGAAYEEARQCLAVNADTAAELVCRKILMHVAADKGAKEGGSFAGYIDFLEHEGYVTPPMRQWVKLIKDHGNAATHELATPNREQAEGTLQFTAQLLRSIYEMQYLADKFAKPPAGAKAEA